MIRHHIAIYYKTEGSDRSELDDIMRSVASVVFIFTEDGKFGWGEKGATDDSMEGTSRDTYYYWVRPKDIASVHNEVRRIINVHRSANRIDSCTYATW